MPNEDISLFAITCFCLLNSLLQDTEIDPINALQAAMEG